MSKVRFNGSRWRLGEADERACALIAHELGLSRVASRVLVRRGPSTPEEAHAFLNPSLSDLPDPFSLPGTKTAAERLALAVERGESIAVFGDYDADGIAGAALISEFLTEAGGRCIVSLPKRKEEGYGITVNAVERLTDQGASLILTVDNGIGAVEAAERARELGVDMVITDHHAVKGGIPHACAVVNPKLAAGDARNQNLAGCGVAFMLALAVRSLLRNSGRLPSPEPNLKRMLDLVALGTIADMVPLTGANRILTSFGLAEIARCTRPGMRALLDVSSTNPEQVNPTAVAFRLAPRINAAGRMDDPALALDLLRLRSYSETIPMARALDAANRKRQDIEEECFIQAMEQIAQDPLNPDRAAIVVDSQGWHIGVLGIVAARLTARFGKPAVVISRDTTPARGSARSANGVSILDALSTCGGLMVRFGGHAEAAGLNIEEQRITELRSRLDEACKSISKTVSPPALTIDALVTPDEVSSDLIKEFRKMEPFGEGNPEPVIMMEAARITGHRIVGNGHLKLTLSLGGRTFDAIGFGMGDPSQPPQPTMSVAFTPQFNTYNGITTVQLKLADLALQGTLG